MYKSSTQDTRHAFEARTALQKQLAEVKLLGKFACCLCLQMLNTIQKAPLPRTQNMLSGPGQLRKMSR